MDFADKIQELANRIPRQLDYCLTEEATKTALVMPFIAALGYDVFNPREVVPEFTADFGVKKGEKVDYAVFRDGHPIMLYECKWSGADLAKVHASQLYRYFSVLPEVRFGVLTNGIEYRFFSDLDDKNVMDKAPFFIFNILDFQERSVGELKKFTKSTFDIDGILESASELKYTAALLAILQQEFDQPSEDFVTYLVRRVYPGRLTQAVKDQFSETVRRALRRFLNEKVDERLKSALEKTDFAEAESIVPPATEATTQVEELDESVVRADREKGIYTTEDEIEAFFAVKGILRTMIDPKRVHMRDTKSYCNILLDNSNRKPICRLHFNREQKYIGLIDSAKKEERVPIGDIDDIYQYADRLRATVKVYEAPYNAPKTGPTTDQKGTIQKGATSYTGSSLVAVHFRDARYPVPSWRDGMMLLLGILVKERPELFQKVAPKMVGTKRPYLTRDKSLLRAATPVGGTEFYVETNLSSQMIANLCHNLVREMGYDPNDLAFETA
jgi:predicted type IV restriction endonuclease